MTKKEWREWSQRLVNEGLKMKKIVADIVNEEDFSKDEEKVLTTLIEDGHKPEVARDIVLCEGYSTYNKRIIVDSHLEYDMN
jgi:hypothetical protein